MEIPSVAPTENKSPLLLIGILLVLTLGVSFLPASWLGIKQEVRRLPPLDLSTVGTDPQSDTDSDGVVSWKEFVSSSLNLSGESQAPAVESDARTIATLNDPNNLTSSFTKNLYIASVALKGNNISDPVVEQQAMEELLAKEAEKLKVTAYTSADFTVSNDSSKTNLRAYGNAMASILDGLITEKTITDDLLSITNFIQSENEGDLIPLTKNTLRVQAALSKVVSLKVPGEALTTHVEVVNTLRAFTSTLENLSRAYDDPVRATLAFEEYTENAIRVIRTKFTLGTFFNSKNIVFSNKEAGYLFTAGYTSTN